MFDSYKDIFNQRGTAYHQAMVELPGARATEFLKLVSLAEITDYDIVCDVPSGGGYLNNHIAADCRLIGIDTAETFTDVNLASAYNEIRLCDNLAELPLAAASVTVLLSLAGVHHMQDKRPFWSEGHRVLTPDGRFCLADVYETSGVAEFLNGFLDRHSSMGHKGLFLNDETERDLRAAGFEITLSELQSCPWHFPSRPRMVSFCKLLFGIDRARESEIESALEQHVGVVDTDFGCKLCWELLYLLMRK